MAPRARDEGRRFAERFGCAQATEPWREALRRLQRHNLPGGEQFPNWYKPNERRAARDWGVLAVKLDAMEETIGITEVRELLRGCRCLRCEPSFLGATLAMEGWGAGPGEALRRFQDQVDRNAERRRQLVSGSGS